MKTANNQVSLVPTQQNKYKGARHFTNAVITTGGVAATGVALVNGVRTAEGILGDEIALSNGFKVLKRKTNKVFNWFEKAGQKMFGDTTRFGQAIKRYVTGESLGGGQMYKPEQIKAMIKRTKTIGAMAVVAGALTLGLLARGIYKAGKINGDN